MAGCAIIKKRWFDLEGTLVDAISTHCSTHCAGTFELSLVTLNRVFSTAIPSDDLNLTAPRSIHERVKCESL